MTPNHLAIVCLLWAAFSTFLRAEMLRNRLDPRPDLERPTYQGNWPMIVAMDIAALAFVGWAFEIAWKLTGFVGWGALATCIAAAVASSVILASMIGHNWRETLRAKEKAAAEEAERTIPEALERGVQRFMDTPQGY